MLEGVQNEIVLGMLVAIDLFLLFDVLGFGGSLVVLGAAFQSKYL